MENETVEKPKISYGRRNKAKGNNAERLYARLFREAGFPFCKTAREGSKMYDDSGIDLLFLPVLVQIKAGKQKGMNPSKVLMDMRDMIVKNFPETSPEHTMPKVVIHHKDMPIKRVGAQRTEFDSLVTMSFDTFIKLLKTPAL